MKIMLSPIASLKCGVDSTLLAGLIDGGAIEVSEIAQSSVEAAMKDVVNETASKSFLVYSLADWLEAHKNENILFDNLPQPSDILRIAFEVHTYIPKRNTVFIIPTVIEPEVEDPHKQIITVDRYLAVLVENIHGGWHHVIRTVQVGRLPSFLEDKNFDVYIVGLEPQTVPDIKTLLG
ncbi:MAG: hypothetical protein WCF94_00420 [bacterium]